MSYVVVLTKGALKLYIACMAKQAGEVFIEGSFDDLCFYKMGGKYYVRMKSSLSTKTFRKDKAFEGSRKSCKRFAEGNRLASKLYQVVEEEKRVYRLFCFLKKRAILLLKEGKSLNEAEEVLLDHLIEFGLVKFKEREIRIEKIKQENYRAIKAAPLPLLCPTGVLNPNNADHRQTVQDSFSLKCIGVIPPERKLIRPPC